MRVYKKELQEVEVLDFITCDKCKITLLDEKLVSSIDITTNKDEVYIGDVCADCLKEILNSFQGRILKVNF
jgi:hypothetical protein